MLKHESCQLGGFGGDALVESLRYCFNPHFKLGSEGQSKVSDCQEFPVSSQVTEGVDRGILPINISWLSKKQKNKNSGFLLLKSACHSMSHLSSALSLIILWETFEDAGG